MSLFLGSAFMILDYRANDAGSFYIDQKQKAGR